MDTLIKPEILSPVLILITYLSSVKNGKFTCDRYLINHFLYLLTSLSIYFTSLKYVNDNDVTLGLLQKVGVSLGIIVLLYSINNVNNSILQHVIWLIVLVLFSLIIRYDKYDRELIENVFQKMMIIILICGLIAINFSKYIKPSMEFVLILALILVLILHIIDVFFLKGKYQSLLSHISVFIFSGLIIYDTNFIIKRGKDCISSGDPMYLDNMVNMFLNLFNLFQNLLEVMDE